MQPEKRNQLLLIIGSVVFIFLIFLIWFLVGGPGSKVTVEIYPVPSDATITMDGKPVQAGKISVAKGKHSFAASRQYFEGITKEVDTDNLSDSKTIYLALYPNSPEGREFLDHNPDEQLRYERVAGADFSALQEKLLEDYPVTTELPYKTVDYKIDYDINEEQDVVFIVTFNPPNALTPGSDLYKEELRRFKNEALTYLKSKGIDTSKTTITFSPDPDAAQ